MIAEAEAFLEYYCTVQCEVCFEAQTGDDPCFSFGVLRLVQTCLTKLGAQQ